MPYFISFRMTNLFQYAALLALCAALPGCADVKWVNRLTGEPDETVGQNRAGIERIDSQAPVWPNLSSVPPRPTDLPPKFSRQLETSRLDSDRKAGLQLLETQKAAAAQQQAEQAAEQAAQTKPAPDNPPPAPVAKPK